MKTGSTRFTPMVKCRSLSDFLRGCRPDFLTGTRFQATAVRRFDP
ncbi:hypothetical protein ACKFKF_08150 [Phormidesmis sp. 146-12]